jgi:hypothetical protein
MPDRSPDAPALAARRDLLRALVLVPAAAACAAAVPAALPPATPVAPASGEAPPDPAGEALRAIREHPLPAAAEPALVFRASADGGR